MVGTNPGKNKKFSVIDPIDWPDSDPEKSWFEVIDIFQLHRVSSVDSGRVQAVRIENDASHVGQVAFTPVGFEYFATSEKRVTLDQNQVVRDGFSSWREYWSYVPIEKNQVELTPQQRSQLWQMPRRLREALQPLATQLTEGCDSDQQRISRVEQYFRENFQYSLETSFSSGRDRIQRFVLEKPPGAL